MTIFNILKMNMSVKIGDKTFVDQLHKLKDHVFTFIALYTAMKFEDVICIALDFEL